MGLSRRGGGFLFRELSLWFIPFYGRTVASDLLYSGALFGLHAWLSRMVARSERVHALQTA